jgi:hypothetical protein
MPKSAEEMIASGPTGAGEQRSVEFQPLPTNTEAPSNTPAPETPAPRPHQQLEEVGNVTPPNVEIGDDTKVSDVLKQFDRLTTKQTEQAKSADKAKTPAPTKPTEKPVEKPVLPPTASEETVEEVTPPTSEEVITTSAVEIPAPLAKQMSKQAQEWVLAEMKRNAKAVEDAKALAANSKGKEATNNAWYEHPNSFVLAEEFQQSQQHLGQYKGILRHYQEQLVRVREGDEWEDLSQDADGRVIKLPAKQKASAKAEALIEERIAIARDLVRQEEGYQQQFINEHQQRSTQVRGVLGELEKRYFPQYVQGIKSKNADVQKYVQAAEQELKVLQQSHNPLTPFMLKLYASFLELKLGGAGQQTQQQVNKVSNTQAQAGPTISSINSSGGQRSVDPDDLPFNPAQWPGR